MCFAAWARIRARRSTVGRWRWSRLRYPMQPYQRRALALRDNVTACDAFYVALAESLDMPLLTDDHKFAKTAGHSAVIETWP
ncbi:type II toxin-antitoxin system VapC family toxin [Bounagaea algeriensis]